MSPVPAPAPVTPGGGHPQSLYDPAGDIEVVRAEDGFAKILDGRGLSGHGKLDTSGGFDAGGDVGVIETWMPESSTDFNDGSWFGFALSATFGALLIGFLDDKWIELGTGVDGTAVQLFQRPGQVADDDAILTIWDEDGVKALTIGDSTLDGGGGGDGPNVVTWWAPNGTDAVNIYSIDGNPELDVVSVAAQFNLFTEGNGTRTKARWHGKSPHQGQGVTISGGDAAFIGIIAEFGQVNGDLFDVVSTTGAHVIRATADNKLGFFNTAPAAKPTGVAVTAAGVHAALVTLGMIAA